MRAERVELAEIVPDVVPFVGQLAYLQLDAFESLSLLIAQVADLDAKRVIARAAGLALGKHELLCEELRRLGADPDRAMLPFVGEIENFRELTAAATWEEGLLGAHVGMGILDDFFLRLSAGLPDDVSAPVARILAGDDGREGVVRVLEGAIAGDQELASRLALWGRRLVGDVLLVARSALSQSAAELVGNRPLSEEARIEPVVTDIIAAHTRRMDALGLTA